jgi:broad specificity phosphatase PhoE
VIALVGLPARGKSFVARKLLHYLNWSGVQCKIFNVGRYRREAYKHVAAASADARAQTGACDADFFDAQNERAAELREKVADLALRDMLRWLDENATDTDEDTDLSAPDISRHSSTSQTPGILSHGVKLSFSNHERIAIFDATNSTDKRRKWLLQECTSPDKRPGKPTGVVFVESICDDQELLEENYRYKISNSPDFDGMTQQEALSDLRKRVTKYEEQYETITDDSLSYMKVFNLSTKLMVNHIYGRMAKELVPALMSWHIGTRPVFLCRPGQTISGILTDGEDYVARNKVDPSDPRFLDMSSRTKRKSLRGDSLGPNGQKFREELLDFCYDEVHSFLFKRASVHDMAYTGTSISGLDPGSHGYQAQAAQENEGPRDPFPMKIITSTMPRAADTVNWTDYEFAIQQMSNLNPLDKGDFAGMELDEIRKKNPSWYERLERNPYQTRFPGGESYADLVKRLTSVVIDVEQQVTPTLVVSHVSILQCLMSYFRNTPVELCTGIEVPMHTVVKFTPVRGGGWSETHHPLFGADEEGKGMIPVTSESEFSQVTFSGSDSPIWTDLVSSKSSSSLKRELSGSKQGSHATS